MLPPSRAETAVTADAALGLSAVYRAAQIWATGVSQLSVDVFRGSQMLEPAPAVVRQPDLAMSRSAFLEQSVMSLAMAGEAFWLLHPKASDPTQVATVEVLNPGLVGVLATSDGTRVAGYGYQGKTLSVDRIQHLQLMRVPGHLRGLGPIQAARREISGALDLQDYAGGWFNRGDIPPGVLTSDQPLVGDQAKQYKAAWYEDTEGIKVLGSGLKFAPLLLSPEDAQFIASQNLTVLQVARMFGIPANLLLAQLEGSAMTYQNIAQADLSFVRWTLQKPLREIEEAFTAIIPRGQTARFNLDGLLRPDTTTRYQAHAVALSAGFMTVDEVRGIEGLPPLGTPDTTADQGAPNE